MAHRITCDNWGILHQNPTASSKSYWDLGSQDPPLFPGLVELLHYMLLKLKTDKEKLFVHKSTSTMFLVMLIVPSSHTLYNPAKLCSAETCLVL